MSTNPFSDYMVQSDLEPGGCFYEACINDPTFVATINKFQKQLRARARLQPYLDRDPVLREIFNDLE